MNKGELVEKVALAINDSKAAATRAVDAVLEAIADGLKATGQVQLAGFGTFKVSQRAARRGRNPRTGQEIEIPATKSVKFHPSQNMKAAL